MTTTTTEAIANPESKWQENVRKARERAAQRDGVTLDEYNTKHPRRERAIEHAEHPDAQAHRERAAARKAAREAKRAARDDASAKRKRISLFG